MSVKEGERERGRERAWGAGGGAERARERVADALIGATLGLANIYLLLYSPLGHDCVPTAHAVILPLGGIDYRRIPGHGRYEGGGIGTAR